MKFIIIIIAINYLLVFLIIRFYLNCTEKKSSILNSYDNILSIGK